MSLRSIKLELPVPVLLVFSRLRKRLGKAIAMSVWWPGNGARMQQQRLRSIVINSGRRTGGANRRICGSRGVQQLCGPVASSGNQLQVRAGLLQKQAPSELQFELFFRLGRPERRLLEGRVIEVFFTALQRDGAGGSDAHASNEGGRERCITAYH